MQLFRESSISWRKQKKPNKLKLSGFGPAIILARIQIYDQSGYPTYSGETGQLFLVNERNIRTCVIVNWLDDIFLTDVFLTNDDISVSWDCF